MRGLPQSFCGLTSLKQLDIITENLALPKTFGRLVSLEELYIHAIETLPASIGNCKNLKDIYIESDKLLTLPQSFCNLKNLKKLHLDTFALKSLPVSFGSLASLEKVDIFSGALTKLPESMGNLRNLKNLRLDFHNLKKLPNSFRKFSYVKNCCIEAQNKNLEVYRFELTKEKRKRKEAADFKNLTAMSYSYRQKLLESYSVKEMESILCSAPSLSTSSEDEKKVFNHVMLKRRQRLNNKFKWTQENKKRVVKVSDEFLKAWEEGYTKAKIMLEALYEKDTDKKTFMDRVGRFVEITLYPEILQDDDNFKEIYHVITGHLPDWELNMNVQYDPAAKNEDFWLEHINTSRELSWNIEGFGDLELNDVYICYALHVLYSHYEWANEDILKINNILVEVKLTCDPIDVF